MVEPPYIGTLIMPHGGNARHRWERGRTPHQSSTPIYSFRNAAHDDSNLLPDITGSSGCKVCKASSWRTQHPSTKTFIILQILGSSFEVTQGMMMRALDPTGLRPPFGRYAHGTEFPGGMRMVKTSGQLGMTADGLIPTSAYDQAMLCFQAISAILEAGGMTSADVIHIAAYVTSRDHMPDYMRARDQFVGDATRWPASTLLIVSGFTRPEFLVEVEVLAAAP